MPLPWATSFIRRTGLSTPGGTPSAAKLVVLAAFPIERTTTCSPEPSYHRHSSSADGITGMASARGHAANQFRQGQ